MLWTAYFEFRPVKAFDVVRDRIRRNPSKNAEFIILDDGRVDCVVRVPADTLITATRIAIETVDGLLRKFKIQDRPSTMRIHAATSAEPVPRLVGVSEIAKILDQSRQRVTQLAKQDGFPRHVERLQMGPVYTLHAIESFKRSRERK